MTPLACLTRSVRLPTYNHLERDEAIELVRPCLPITRWWTAMVDGRPFGEYEALLEAARDAAYPMTFTELEAAVDGHLTHRRSASSRRLDADDTSWTQDDWSPTWTGLEQQYQNRFGRPFIVRAAGRSEAEIRGLLLSRLSNSPEVEDKVVGTQLRQIALLALTRRVTE